MALRDRGIGKEPETDFEAPAKPTRIPFGSKTQKLAYPPRVGFHRHWFNDEPGRIERALEAGYTHVEKATGEKVQRVVGRYEGGTPMIGYLMEIPQEWYDEDMKAEQDEIDEREATIRRGKIQAAQSDSGRYYDSAQGRNISIKRN